VVTGLTGAHLRLDRALGASTITCSRCAYCVCVGRGDRAALLIALGDLHDAGWRASGRAALCPTCASLARAEAAARAAAPPADPSPSRTALRQYARTSTGETRRWALTLLREWGG
jgi:hypothetical protein